jgi:choline dehydrogenase
VDAELRICGVKNLRVADGSIMPSVTTGNIQAPRVMTAEITRDGVSKRSTGSCATSKPIKIGFVQDHRI